MPLLARALVVVGLVFTASAPAWSKKGKAKPPPPLVEEGEISYYADKFVGRSTASGEKYSHKKATCAHKQHRFGTLLRVTVLATGKSVICRVNDRGPYVKGRVVDLSRSLAKELGFVDQGVAQARVEVVKPKKAPKPLKKKTR